MGTKMTWDLKNKKWVTEEMNYGSKKASQGGTESTVEVKKPFEDVYSDWVRRRRQSEIDQFLKDADSYFGSAESDYKSVNYGTSRDTSEKRKARMEELMSRRSMISAYLKDDPSLVDEETLASLTSYLDSFDMNARKVQDSFDRVSRVHNRFASEKDYDTAVRYNGYFNKYDGMSADDINVSLAGMADGEEKEWLRSYKGQKEYENLLSYDTKAGQKEIDDLEALLQEYDFLIPRQDVQNPNSEYNVRLREIRQQYGSKEDIKNLISEKSAYMTRSQRLREGIALSGVADKGSSNYDPEFNNYSGYVSTKKDGWLGGIVSQYGMGYEDLTYEYINGADTGIRDDIIRKSIAYNSSSSLESVDKWKVYDYMTENEVNIYNYYYAKEGKEAADHYLGLIEETLITRKATGRYEGALEGKTGLELLFSLEAGLDQFESGIQNFFNFKDDYIPYSEDQVLSGMVREDLADNGAKLPDWMGGASVAQAAYDVGTTSANMLPSILVSAVPVVGSALGAASMGASAAGNAYQEMLNLGYGKGQARVYSSLVGASEAGLQYLLGGIGKLGGVADDAVTKTILGHVDNAFARVAIQLGANAVSEGFEEGLQEVLTPWFKNIAFGMDEDVNWSEVLYSSLLGALTANLFEGPGIVAQNVGYNTAGKQLQAADISAARLAEIGKTFSADTVAYQLAGRVNENTGAYTLGRLFNEIGATLSEQNVSEITEALVAKGMDRKTAQKNAKALALVVEGGELSDRQAAAIEANDVLAEAARTTLIDTNTTWNQRTQGYNAALKALADDVANQKVSQTEQSKPATDKAPATDSVDTQNKSGAQEVDAADTAPARAKSVSSTKGIPPITDTENASNISRETSTDGKTVRKSSGETITVKEISSIENGKVLLKLENGDIVDAKDVEFGNEGDAFVYETVAAMGVPAADANEMISAYRSSKVAGDVYAKGLKDAYNYGAYGYLWDGLSTGTYTSKLTVAQRAKAFKLGREKAGSVQGDGSVKKRNTARKRGRVKGYGVTVAELNRSFNTTQQSAYKILDTIAAVTGINIVLYRSTSDVDGNLHGGVVEGIDMSKAHGAFSWQNDKIYIDINAGVLKQADMADVAKYSMLRTFGHEFTHFLEKHNPVEYENFRDLVFDVMRRNGKNPDAMIEDYMAQDSSLTRDKASREVVAEAMTDILPESSFIQELAEKHQNIFQKLLDKLKEFVAELKAHFQALGLNRSAEAAAVKEHINGALRYAEELVEMFDRIAVQAVERYQAAQTAEKSTAAKSNGVQLEIKQIGESGNFYVQADRQVLTGDDPDVWGKQIERYINDVIRNQLDITIPTTDGHILLLTGRSSYKLSDRHISMIADKVAGFLSDEEFALKGRVATHIDELIQVARFDKYKPDKDGKHENDIGEDGFNTFVAHFRDFDGKYYRIPFTAGINAAEETAYSIGRIRQRSFPANRGSSPTTGRSKGGKKASGDIIYSSSDQSQAKTAVQIAFENAQTRATNQKTQKQARIPGDNGETVSTQQEVSFSLRRDTQLMDKAISKNKQLGFVDGSSLQKAKADREAVKAEMERLGTELAVALPEDIEGNTFVSNSSYDGTEENTTICPRSLAAEALVDAVSEYVGRPLTVQEQLDISQDLQGRTLTPECLYCYVATDRKAYRAFLGDYVQQRDAVISAYKNGNTDVARYSKKYKAFLKGRASTDTLVKGFNTIYRDVDHQVYGSLYGKFLDGRKDTDNMWKRFNLWIDTYKSGKPMVQASHLANISKLMGDVQNEFGHDLKAQIKDAMAYAQSASWAKKRVGYLAYNGHILNWKQQRIDRLNSHYGLRMYSFSDFSPAFILENMQMITDASVRGLKMLSYSKEIDFVKIFASTGMNINVSTFGFERNGNVYENNIIGAAWKQAQELRSKHPNVGITFVATNDTLVNWALDQDWIDVVIPYHLVRTGAEIAKALGYTNYTGESADRKTVDWTKGIDEASISPQMHNNDKSMYLAELERNHLRPRFARWLSHPNYMKLVNETRQNAIESRPVRPEFDLAAAKESLAKLAADGYYKPIGGTVDRMYEIAAEIGDKIERNNTGGMSLQRRTSTLTNRDLLAEATGENEYERLKLNEYQETLQNSREQVRKLAEQEKEFDQLQSAGAVSNKKRLGLLRDEIIKTKNRIKIYDGMLSRLEAKDLNSVVVREKGRILDRLQTEYGAIPQGENPVREDTLPMSTDGSNRVSYTARTVKGAEVTQDAFADLIDVEVAKGNLTHIPITNDAATQKAVQYIQSEGWEVAKGYWSANVRAGKTGAEMSAMGALLLNNAARAGDKAAWLDILHDYQIMGTNTAQGLQALRILKKLQPDDSLYMIHRSIRQMVEDMHLDTEITLDPQLETKYQNAKTDTERDAALKEIIKSVADQIPSTFSDKWTALRYVNMLGNLRTQIRNLTGNLGMKAVTSLKNTIAAGLEQILYLASGGDFKRTKSVVVNKELLKAAKNDFATVEEVILGGGKYSDTMAESTVFARSVQEQRKIFKLKPLEGYRKITNWAMEQGDLVFSKSAYARALAGYLQVRGIKGSDLSKVDVELMSEARLYAVKEAQEATFRDTNWLSGWISKVGRRKDTPKTVKVISEGIVPFRKTPANVLIRAEEYSPLGVVNSLVTSIQAMRKGSEVTGAQVINSWAKTLTGTALFGLGMLLQNLGMLTGAADDDEDKDRFESLNGWQNYAIVLPDGTNLTIDFLSPAAMPMFMGAQMMSLMQDGGIEVKEVESALLSVADPMIQMSMLQGVNDTLENIQYSEDNLGQFLINACMSYLTQGLTNTLIGQLERSFEKNRMSTYVDKDSTLPNWLQKQLGKASAKILGWDYAQIPYINAWGEEEEYAGLPANMAYNLLSPSYIDKGVEDWVSVELARLNEIQSDVNTLPRTPEKTISYEDKDRVIHEDYNLSAEEYMALAKEQGQTQRKILEKMLSSELYGSLPDQYKAKAVALAYDYAREKAQIEVLGRNSFSSQWMSEIKDDIAEGIVSHVIEENIKGMYLDGDISADEAVARRVKYCGDTQEEAEEKLRKWEAEVKNGFAYDELKQNFLDGTISAADVITTLMTVEKKTRDEAKNRIVEYARDAYDGGIFDRNEALSAMVSGGLTRNEADSKLRYIDVKKQFPDAYIDNDWVDEYYEEVETSGVSIALFIDYRNQVKGITGEGKKARRMAVIDSLPITNAQKDALYYAEGWVASTIDEAPWHR